MDTAVETTHYVTLGVPVDADAAAIKKAYRRLAKDLHPDLHPDDTESAARFALVNAAHAVLGDPAARQLYDLELAAPAVLEVPEGEPWGEQIVLDVNAPTATFDAVPAVSRAGSRPDATFTVSPARLIWAGAWTVIPLAVAFFAPELVGAPGWILYASLAVAGLAAHRGLFSTRWSVGVLVLAVIVAAGMPALAWGDGAVALAVALISGVPLVGAGELTRSTRSDH